MTHSIAHMWSLFKMTQHNMPWPTYLLQHIMKLYAMRTFWWTTGKRFPKVLHTNYCQDGHRFLPETPLSSQCRSSKSRGFGQTTSLWTPVIKLELGVQQRLGTLTCFNYHQIFWSFHCITVHIILCFSINFQLWLTTTLPKENAELHGETIAGCWCQHSHKEPYIIQYNMVQLQNQACRLDWLMILPRFHHLLS